MMHFSVAYDAIIHLSDTCNVMHHLSVGLISCIITVGCDVYHHSGSCDILCHVTIRLMPCIISVLDVMALHVMSCISSSQY